MNTEHTCCAGDEPLTPEPTANRPGLPTLRYRVGRHGSFLASMRARLSSAAYPALGRLRTRDTRDPAVALLDSWATIADVLTFYQERIANEGFLRTATERRSLTELARLVGYQPRPGLAASTHLAFTLEDSVHDEVEIPKGARAQSLPGPGELPQPFETAEPLKARAAWNRLPPRLNRPQSILEDTLLSKPLYLQGLNSGLKRHDPLLIVLPGDKRDVYRVDSVAPDPAGNRTAVMLARWSRAASEPSKRELPAAALLRAFAWQTAPQIDDGRELIGRLIDLLQHTSEQSSALPSPYERRQVVEAIEEALNELHELIERQVQARGDSRRIADRAWEQVARPAVGAARAAILAAQTTEVPGPKAGRAVEKPPTDTRRLELLKRNLGRDTIQIAQLRPVIFDANVNPIAAAVAAVVEEITQRLLEATDNRASVWRGWETAQPETRAAFAEVRVYALRLRASLFGHNVPLNIVANGPPIQREEWTLADEDDSNTIWLDNAYDGIAPGSIEQPSYIVTQRPDPDDLLVLRIAGVSVLNRAEYGISGKTTRIRLAEPWPNPAPFDIIRGTLVYTQSEPLALALEPDTADVPDPAEPQNCILLGGLYDGLTSGRRLIVSGERADRPGLLASELATIATTRTVRASAAPGDADRTQLVLIEPLRYRYKRGTVTLYGNVVRATHGETRNEALGSGDAARALQRFALQQSPLTHLPAPTTSGAESALELRVNTVRWHVAERMADLGPADRAFVLRIDDEQKATAIFGDGERGARLPTGQENVRATYRFGLGAAGNVKAGQISQLATRPYGVKAVVNPLAASGGADRESAEQLRQNAALALMALGRLLAVRDYADFARAYAGIGKASAARFFDGGQQAVYLTIAGTESKPIADSSELYRNLGLALRRFGDPRQPLVLLARELAALVIHAYVRIHPDYLWEQVAGRLRAALLDTFGYDRRELGQAVTLSELLSAIQQVEGVAYADVDLLECVPESLARAPDESLRHFLEERVAGLKPGARAAQRLRAELARVATSHGVRDASESLLSIAERYRVDLGDLQRLNPSLPSADMPLEQGMNIILPDGSIYPVAESKTLVVIAETHKTSVEQLRQLNPGLPVDLQAHDHDPLTAVRLPFTVLPAQLLVLLPEIPETLLLEQLL